MSGTLAWKRHGCYKLGSTQYFNMPLDKATLGCHDDWNALDHFDPTTDSRRLFAQFNHLRTVYGALQDGWNLVQRGNWTYHFERPGSNHTATEMGLWSISRSGLPGVQTLTGRHNDQVWMLYTNENTTKTWTYDCKGPLWISSPFQSGTTVRNLFAPYETYTVEESMSAYYNDGKAPWFGCLKSVSMDAFGFKMLVPTDQWSPPRPALTKFTPGHDARIVSASALGDVDISLEFNTEMDCNGVTNSISLEMASSGHGNAPKIANIHCRTAENPNTDARVQGVSVTQWMWSATLTNFPDGVLRISVNNPPRSGGNEGTGASVICLPSPS